MDIFFKSEYIGSIIIDTKYRSLKKIITGNSVYKNNAMEQLRNYKNHPASLKLECQQFLRHFSCVNF